MDFNLQTQVGPCLCHKAKAQNGTGSTCSPYTVSFLRCLSAYWSICLPVGLSVCLPFYLSARCPGSGYDSETTETGLGDGLPAVLRNCLWRKQVPQHGKDVTPEGGPQEGPALWFPPAWAEQTLAK